MKILRVISSMDPATGGPCQGIRNAVPALAKLGVINEVVCLDDPAAPFLKKDAFIIHAVGKAEGGWQYNKNLIPWLNNNLHRFDAVIIHGLWLYHGHATQKTVRRYNQQHPQQQVRVYVMPHGMLDPWFQKAPGRKLKAIRNWLYWKLIEGKVVNGVDGVLFTCEEELLLAKQSFSPYHPGKELNVGYGILTPPAHHAAMDIAFYEEKLMPQGQPYFLFLSRIHEKKGVDILIKAYLALQQKDAGLPYLVIAGPGMDTEYGAEMKALASTNNKIVFTGMLTGDSKWGAFYNSTAFILPSHQENFGIAVVEALACGKPVLISTQINIWREIETAGAAIVKEDTETGAYEMMHVWQQMNAAERKEMGDKARKLFEEKFTVANAAKQMLSKLNNE